MIRMIQSTSAAHAKAYFTEALSKSDYYINNQELAGVWQGHLADRLGIRGLTDKETFFALCENRNPVTHERLTPRKKDARRVGYDINFHCPKSVSILHALSDDGHILQAFQASVTETMHAIEADSKTRVRQGGANGERATGELIWGHFVHQTARPVGGFMPDPHLHSHCFVFNATWDAIEGRIKAGEFADIKRDMPFYQAQFHMRLANKLAELGYKVRQTSKAFEIEGVPQNVIDLFSKRTDEIGRVAKEKGITDPAELAELGARTRAAKDKGATMEELRAAWQAQVDALGVTPEEAQAPIRFAPGIEKPAARVELRATAAACIDFAVAHCFSRASVMEDRRLLQAAYRHALGQGVTPAEIDAAFAEDKRIIRLRERGRLMCTTKEVLAEEKRMIGLARRGLDAMQPLYSKAPKLSLKGQQAAAVTHVLTTTHRISIIRGAAGAGKTTLMKEAVPLIEATGKKVITVAPSSTASRGVLREAGFAEANTVAHLFENKEMQASLRNQVLWVDEAGLLGTQDMLRILELAEKQNARVILGGDTRQHSAVNRGDALRILNIVGGIKAAEVDKIYRQEDLEYRAAIQDLAQGKIGAGFAKLDKAGFIKEVEAGEAAEQLAAAYLAARREKIDALVVSPTHDQGEVVTEMIRTGLRADRKIGKKEVEVSRLINLNFTDAEKTDERLFSEGQIVQFTQNVSGFLRGSRWTVQKAPDNVVQLVGPDGTARPLPKNHSNRYNVFEAGALPLAKGDIVRITHNSFDKGGRRLDNGDVLTVAAVSKSGNIILRNEKSKVLYAIDKDFGHVTHAYCVTSHFSQAKTVDLTLVYQPAATFPATDAKQFYVSTSRGRQRVMIYTDDKKELLAHASKSGDRQSAIELERAHKLQRDFALQAQRETETHKRNKDHDLNR